jgi:hypothetical protein
MNRSLLIAICDFTILSILSVASFGPTSDQKKTEDVPQAKSSIQDDLYDHLKSSIDLEREERLAQAKKLEEQKRLAEEREKRLEKSAREQRELAAKLDAERQALEKERLMRLKKDEALRKQSETLSAVRAQSQELQKASEAQKKELTQTLSKMETEIQRKKAEVEKMEALARQEELKRKEMMLKAEAQKQKLASEKTKLAQRLAREEAAQKQMLASMMRKDKVQEELLVEIRRKAEEAEQAKKEIGNIRDQLQEQNKELLQSQLAMAKVEHEKTLAKQEIQYLTKSLEITQEQVVSSQSVNRAVLKLEDQLEKQNQSMDQSLEQVTQVQRELGENLKRLKTLSSHEIFEKVQRAKLALKVKARIPGLFGVKEEEATFDCLPIALAGGSSTSGTGVTKESHFLFHFSRSPMDWSPMWSDVQQWQVSLKDRALGSFSFAPFRGDEEIMVGKVDALEDLPHFELHPDPKSSEFIVVVDLKKMNYAQFPLRWHPSDSRRLLITSGLSNQMFGPLAIRAGQMIFGSDGRIIGPVMENKEGYWIKELNTKEWWPMATLAEFKSSASGREAWRLEVDPPKASR